MPCVGAGKLKQVAPLIAKIKGVTTSAAVLAKSSRVNWLPAAAKSCTNESANSPW